MMKVFLEEDLSSSIEKYVEFTQSDLNLFTLYNGIQPFFIDINGDMKVDMLY